MRASTDGLCRQCCLVRILCGSGHFQWGKNDGDNCLFNGYFSFIIGSINGRSPLNFGLFQDAMCFAASAQVDRVFIFANYKPPYLSLIAKAPTRWP